MSDTLSAADLIDGMSMAARAESAAIATRLGFIGQLDALRTVERSETVFWRSDPFDGVAAEVSAALTISRGRAGSQIIQARALRKMPQVAALFQAGVIDYCVVSSIIARTTNVTDESWPELDAALAQRAKKWLRLSNVKLQDRIDLVIAKYDPDAVRVPPRVEDNRYVEIGPTVPGMGGIWGNVHAADASQLSQRLDALAATVCEADPRTHVQRRADACGPLARLQEWMECLCGSDDCPVAAERKAATAVVVHLLVSESTLDGTGNDPGWMPGFGIQPAETVRDVARAAKIKPVRIPGDATEPGYRPSAALSEFVRWRDLTCRWPGCDKPAENCDIDHTTPYPAGPTHPSNSKMYCRSHHLIKTFCLGWSDQQFPDGTVEVVAPTGHVYRTEPHGATLFPVLARPTGDLLITAPPESTGDRGVMMPKRRQTRQQDRNQRIDAERRQRAQLNAELAEQERRHRAWLHANSEPPPF